MSKKRKEVVASIKDAAAKIKDGQTVAIGGADDRTGEGVIFERATGKAVLEHRGGRTGR